MTFDGVAAAVLRIFEQRGELVRLIAFDNPVPTDVAEDTIIARLLALNLERSAQHGVRI